MAKRFIDTAFFKSPFVRGLKGPLKVLYSFIICDCDGSGIWTKDLEAASLYTGFNLIENDFVNCFVKTGKAVDLKNGRFFFPDFIEHQYPGGLSKNNIAHKNFILELTKYQLIDENLKPHRSPFKGSKVMVEVKEEGKVLGKEGVLVTNPEAIEVSLDFQFKVFWDLYDKKRGDKAKLLKKWKELTEEDRIKIMQYVPEYIKATPDKKYRKDPATFFNNKSWNDELIFDGTKKNFNDHVTTIHKGAENVFKQWEQEHGQGNQKQIE